jgi:Domain of unknown function (DUF4838)
MCEPGKQKATLPRRTDRTAFKTRGVVLAPEDLTLEDWPERAQRAGLTTVALHHQHSPKAVANLIQSDQGQQFLEVCRRLRLEVEYELHAMKELLPRHLFAKDSSLFRMNEQGERTPDANLCVHSRRALELVGEQATVLAKVLRPTTSRYFLWGDDGQPWCRCPKCRGLSDSDQALLLENHLYKVLREQHDKALLAHLAYSRTLTPPKQVKPEEGVFLEYAPIGRRYDIPYSQQTDRTQVDGLHALDANMEVFHSESAQVLEYWLDVSRFSKWKKPAVKLPWNKEVFIEDLDTYYSRGIRHITTFAVWIDTDYLKRYGEATVIAEYGAGLSGSARE